MRNRPAGNAGTPGDFVQKDRLNGNGSHRGRTTKRSSSLFIHLFIPYSFAIYANIPQNIPPRATRSRSTGRSRIYQNLCEKLPAETVYNSYTGLGGLHGLDRKDFDSYNDYAGQKEFEMGQFFTPHDLCARMVALASPDPSEMVLDKVLRNRQFHEPSSESLQCLRFRRRSRCGDGSPLPLSAGPYR